VQHIRPATKSTAVNDHRDHQPLFKQAPGRAPLLLTLDEYDPAQPVKGKCSGYPSDGLADANFTVNAALRCDVPRVMRQVLIDVERALGAAHLKVMAIHLSAVAA
jgi:hypothetical protein